MFPGGATGGRGSMSIASDNVSMSPTFSDSVFSDFEEGIRNSRESRIQRPTAGPGSTLSSSNIPIPPMDSNRLFVPIKKKRAQSPPSSSPDRASESATFGSTSSTRNRLVDFDLEPRYEHYTNRPSSEPASLASGSSIHKDTGARPKTTQIVNVNGSGKKCASNGTVSNLKLKENYSAAFSINKDIRPISNDSGISSNQFLESSEDVQISEQQNTNVDETRFSAALSLFDPLSQDGGISGGDLLEGTGSPTTTRSPFQSFSNANYSESLNKEFDPLASKDAASSQFEFSESAPNCVQKNVIELENNELFLQAETGTKPRRGSTDSNRSSGSSLSKDGERSMEVSQSVEGKVIKALCHIVCCTHLQ